MNGADDVAALIAKKNYTKAIELIKKQLQTQKNDPRLRLQLGDVLVSAGKAKEAVSILLPLADEFAKEGFAAKAIAVLKKIQKLEPSRRDIDQKLASLIQEKQRHATVAVTPTAAPVLEIGIEEIGFEPPTAASRGPSRAPAPVIEMEAEELSIAPSPSRAPTPGPPTRAATPSPPPRIEPKPAPTPAPEPELSFEPEASGSGTGELAFESEPLDLGGGAPSPPAPARPAPPPPAPQRAAAAPPPAAPPRRAPAPPAPAAGPAAAPPVGEIPEITLEPEPELELERELEPEPAAALEAIPAAQEEFALDDPLPSEQPAPVVDQDLFTGEFEEVEPEAEVVAEPAIVDPMTDAGFADELLSVIDDAFQALPMTPDGGVSFGSDAPSSAEGAQIVVSPLFKDFSVDELVAVIQGLTLLSFERGQVILREGEPGDSLYMLTSGTVKAFVKRGGKQVPVGELEEGAFFGEMSILTGKPRAATVVAKTACELLELNRATLDGITQTHPHVWDVLQEFASQRMVQKG